MKSLTITEVPERCLWGALIFCTVYESYRYPLKINQTGTSPTYSDTPVAFQAAKFLVVLLICLVALPYIPKRLLAYKKWVLAGLVTCMSAYSVFKAATVEFGNTAYINAAFWPLAVLILVLSARTVTFTALNRYFRFVLFYALASTAVEVLLFVTIRRLPALAYANSLAVRFGAFLDDPNGFSAIWYMLMGWAYYCYSGRKRWIMEAVLVFCLLLTQSFTAIGYLVLLALFFSFRSFVRKPKPILVLGLGTILAVFLSFTGSQLFALLSAIVQTRRGSVDEHLSQVTTTSTSPGLDWIFGTSTYKALESYWVGSLLNFGIPWYLINLLVTATLVFAVYRALKRARDRRQKAVMSGMLMFCCYFVFANLNLPMFLVFPINVIFFFFCYLVFFGKIVEHGVETGLGSTGADPPFGPPGYV